ncbi:hypothetical protein F52700_6722 [Fusarium sp. NRRL 52700]|nr:hypothetical protein F52700_6722 [Fusarium sp. NRRL 52700]
MARTRPSARRRRNIRNNREKLRQAIAMQEQEGAEASAQCAASSAQTSTTANATEAATSASAHDAKETADATKARRCKRRHLPDRHYYHQENKLDRHFFVLERRLNHNIAKGRAALDADYRSHNDILLRTKNRLARKEERFQNTHREGMRAMEKVVSRLEGQVKSIADENNDLHEQLLKERRRVRQMMSEHSRRELDLLERLHTRL